MPTVLQAVPYQPEESRRMKFTREHCQGLREREVLDERYELIEGDVLIRQPQSRFHSKTKFLFALWLREALNMTSVIERCCVEVSEADHEFNEPEPDIVAIDRNFLEMDRFPAAKETLLLVEVADTTLTEDKTKKAALFSRAGFCEYWVADVNARQIIVHREPTPKGYRDIRIYSGGEMVSLFARPEISTSVEKLFPPKTENAEKNDEN